MLGPRQVEEAERTGKWEGKPFILTYTGKQFLYDEVTPDVIDIRDIAHSLSQLCRYTGHTNLFYSVAQHSLLVSEKMPGGPAAKLVGLLHDGAEAYTNDLASPLKRWLQTAECEERSEHYDDSISSYCWLQNKITAAIYSKFGVTSIPDDVRLFDGAAGVFEAAGFLGLSSDELAHYSFPMHLIGLWQPWDPQTFAARNSDLEMGEVETRFLKRFEDLTAELGRGPYGD